MTSVKCPLCSHVSFTDAQSLLEHFTPCIMEKYHAHQTPDPLPCSMCKLPLLCLVDAMAHVRTCGKFFCGMLFTKTPPAINSVPPSVILGHEPQPPIFHFPDADPFVPSPTEMLRRSQLTARFLLMANYFDPLTQTGPILIASWDFIYHRHMKRAGPKSMVSRIVSPNRGVNYSQEKHVIRRLEVLCTKYTESELDDICKLDRELGLDYAAVARMYLDLFVFQHFKESIALLQEWDRDVHPPNGSGKYESHRNIYSMNDVRANARYHLVHNGNPTFYQILDTSYSRVRFSLNCDTSIQLLASWINTGRNITVIERSSLFPPVGNFLIRTIKDVIDQHSRVLYHRTPKRKIRQFGPVGAFGGKTIVGAICVKKRSPRSSSSFSTHDDKTAATDNDSVSDITQASTASPPPCAFTNPGKLSIVSPALELAIPHYDNDVATGGMDYVKTPCVQFPDIESKDHITKDHITTNTALKLREDVVVSDSANTGDILTGNTNLVTNLPTTQLKPTSPSVVVASTGLPTVPQAIADAIALNQQLAIKAITAHQQLYPKKLKKKKNT